jgi:hypothetical protein
MIRKLINRNLNELVRSVPPWNRSPRGSRGRAATEPTQRDLDLAEALGFEFPKQIRKLVRRNINELGVIATVAITSGKESKGGPPATEYHLNERQAELFPPWKQMPATVGDVLAPNTTKVEF